MPLYDYKCAACGNVWEVNHPAGARMEKLSCSRCGSTRINRVFGNIFFSRRDSSSPTVPTSSCTSCPGGTCSTCSN